jgi:hypothetical protein
MSMNFAFPHSCQTYWWGTEGFFRTIIECIETYVDPDYYHPVEDINQLKSIYAGLTPEEQANLLTTLNNLAVMAKELGDNWVNPYNRDNDQNVAERIRNYDRLESEFYQLAHAFVENPNNSSTVAIVSRILQRYVNHGSRFYNAFLNVFGIE